MSQPETLSIAPQPAWYQRAHRALLPDYNRMAKAYWCSIVAIGTATIVFAIYQVASLPTAAIAQTLAGIVVATLAGMFPVKIPHSKNSIAAGDIFIFLMLLMLGPAPATLAAASEAGVASYLSSRRWSSRIVSPAIAAVAMFACGSAYQFVAALIQGPQGTNAGLLVGTLMLMSVAYFAANALLTTAVVRLKRNEPMRPLAALGELGWVGVAFAASASIAGLLYLTSQQFGISVLIAAAPIIAMFLVTLHYYFNRQEADDEIRRARLESAEREAAQAAKHVRELEESESRFHSAFTHASIGMALVSFDGRILQVNSALQTLLDLGGSTMVGRNFNDFVFDDDVAKLASRIASLDERGVDSFAVELRCRHREGGEAWVALHGSYFSDSGATQPCLILQVQDIGARRLAEGRLKHIAFHDSLTNLPNRSRFRDSLVRAIELARLGPPHQFAVMFLDLDRFKLINDSMGHGVGDEFLVRVTRRLRENVRPGDEVARLGGDEFAVLCTGLDCEEMAVELAERLQLALSQPMQVGGSEVTSSASIGITFSSVGYESPEEVLRDADIAMYRAKSCGKARHALFDASLRAQVSERVCLERDLRRALECGEIWVAYQPMFSLSTGKLSGFEALARWSHPHRGAVSPEVFIPLAEEAGLMVPISSFVLEQACRQLRAWQLKGREFEDLGMQVNVCATDLAHPAFTDRVMRTIAAAGLKPEHMTIELTENILMKGLEGGVESLNRLRELGIGISVDDFGTGYSSLSHLSTLPIDSLKIDRSFVQNLRGTSRESEIVRAIVALGKSLGKEVIAEGIENSAQLLQLRAIGCEFGQGFHLAHPQPAERAEAMLDAIQVRGLRPDLTSHRLAATVVYH